MADRVQEILSWYSSDNAGTKRGIARFVAPWKVGGTGKLGDSARGPRIRAWSGPEFCTQSRVQSLYHFQLAIDAGCNACAAPLGFLGKSAPLSCRPDSARFTKLNNHDVLHDEKDPLPSGHRQREGRAPARLFWRSGSRSIRGHRTATPCMNSCARIAEDAKDCGLAGRRVVVPARVGILSKEGEAAIDVVAYAAQIAAQLGAHVIKGQAPTAHLERGRGEKVLRIGQDS